jgi:pilus assembly protein CpaB
VTLRTVVMVALALVFGVAAAALAVTVVNQSKPAPPAATVPVVVAAEDIPRGASLSANMLRLRDYPEDLLPNGVITRLEDALDRAAYTQVTKGEPLLEGKLASRGSGRGMAGLTLKGMRTVTIQTNLSAGVAGFVLPGDRVDVLLTVTGGGFDDPTGGGITTRLLQNVEVVAVDQRLAAPADNKVDVKDLRSVTLLVRPDQDAMLALAQTRGTLHLSLRNSGDNQATPTKLVTLADLRIRREPPREKPVEKPAPEPVKVIVPPPPPPAQPVRIRTVRGNFEGSVFLEPQ